MKPKAMLITISARTCFFVFAIVSGILVCNSLYAGPLNPPRASKQDEYRKQIFREFKPLGAKMVCQQQKYLACIKLKKNACQAQVMRAHEICARRLFAAVPPINSKRPVLNQFSTKYLNCIVKEHVRQLKRPRKKIDVCLKKLK